MERKTLFAWVREFFSSNESELTDLPEVPPEETVGRLIDKATGKPEETEKREKSAETDSADSKPCRCTYAMKRNIVESMEEIRRFAEKHELAAAVVKALLTLLAEIALGAMKGKVGEKALETLLKAFNYTRHVDEAYLRGKNESIIREYFPESHDIPHLGGMDHPDNEEDNIFTIAKDA